ncbi:hypothetical protein [Lacunisphaera limnophila]|uniref:hypothetical protein n=1 Tax=Lacunisphaera limnophila TaxID=1838286 RepID=UPI0012FD2FF6|nr:hypothetical protein [Lacunisphaera limnophila]
MSVSLLTACNWTTFLAFRGQMRAISKFTAWDETAEGALLFREPLLSLEDLNAIGIYPEVIDAENAVLRYRRVNGPDGSSGDFDFRMKFLGGRLSALIFPQTLLEGLGRRNISGLFAMIGGSNSPGAGIDSVPKSQLVAVGLFDGTAEALGMEAAIELAPVDRRNRPIILKMKEHGRSDRYDHFHLNIRRSAE